MQWRIRSGFIGDQTAIYCKKALWQHGQQCPQPTAVRAAADARLSATSPSGSTVMSSVKRNV